MRWLLESIFFMGVWICLCLVILLRWFCNSCDRREEDAS